MQARVRENEEGLRKRENAAQGAKEMQNESWISKVKE